MNKKCRYIILNICCLQLLTLNSLHIFNNAKTPHVDLTFSSAEIIKAAEIFSALADKHMPPITKALKNYNVDIQLHSKDLLEALNIINKNGPYQEIIDFLKRTTLDTSDIRQGIEGFKPHITLHMTEETRKTFEKICDAGLKFEPTLSDQTYEKLSNIIQQSCISLGGLSITVASAALFYAVLARKDSSSGSDIHTGLVSLTSIVGMCIGLAIIYGAQHV